MDFEKNLEIIQDILGDYKRGGRDEFLFFCPECQYGVKLSINFHKSTFKCWYCLWKGSLNKLVKKLGSESQKIRWFGLVEERDTFDYDQLIRAVVTGKTKLEENVVNDIKIEEEFPYDNYWNLYECRNYNTASAPLNYLLNERGLSWSDIRKYQIGYCLFGRYKHRVVIPSFDRNGSLNYFVARTYDKQQSFRYYNSRSSKNIIFNEYRIDWNEPIILEEGVFDVIKTGDKNAIPLLGTEMNEEGYLMSQLLLYKPRIFLALDPNARKRQNKIAKMLSSHGLEVILVEYKGQEDFGDKKTEEIEMILKMSDTNNFTDYNFLINKIMGV